MDEINQDPCRINRNLYINKRKSQHEILDLPISKYVCLEKSSSPETCFPSNFQSDVEDLRNSRKERSINNNTYSKYDQLGEGSGKDSNSFCEDADSVMSVSNDSKNELLHLKICQYDQHSTSSVNCAGRFFDTSVNSVNSLETKTCDEVSMNRDYNLYASSSFKEQRLDCGDVRGSSSSDYETGKIQQLEDEALEDLFCSNEIVSNNFVLSSGRWNVNQVILYEEGFLTPSNDGVFLHTVTKEIVPKFIKDYEKEYGSSGSTSRSKLEIFEDESKLLLELMERQKEKRRSNRDKATHGVIDRLYDGISMVLEKYFEEEKCSLDISDDNFSERNDTNQSRSPSLNDLGGDEDETAAIGDDDETSATGDEFVDVSAHVEETGAASNKRGKWKVHFVTRRYSLRRKNLKKSSKEGSKE